MDRIVRTRDKRVSQAVVVVAHPDDEILWMGGMLLMHRHRNWKIVTLCRGSDPDRAPKFYTVLKHLGVSGIIGDMNDGPEQNPLQPQEVRDTIKEISQYIKNDISLEWSETLWRSILNGKSKTIETPRAKKLKKKK